MKARAIRIPRDALILNPERIARAVENGMQAAAEGVRADFYATTNTWERGVSFTISRPGAFRRIIGTDDEIWTMLNQGTKPHLIYPRRAKALAFATGGRAKTKPRVLGSSAGSQGSTFVTTRGPVQHPGTKAREWDTTAQKKWQQELATVVQRSVDSEV
jgi:hypothetical protein